MRVIDIERDMRDMIPLGVTRDSEFLFERLTEVTLSLAEPRAGRRILDVASGLGQDAMAMASAGAVVAGAEPSGRMANWAREESEKAGAPLPLWVRGWSDALPFASGSFDAVICKGSIDHFDRPGCAIQEMARVAAPHGRVVLAIANFESLACRIGRAQDDVREVWLRRDVRRGRRGYDVPIDHFTRYDLELMREQASEHLELEVSVGVSLGWGVPVWSRFVERLPRAPACVALQALDAVARRLPGLADTVVLAGRPRPRCSRSTSR
ncbi:MAG: methyltransferase domain-containing protein [Deltaproteobacteria bacterium]|nr:MAG: methyltransferase domain-containing protein [Deltaproteobacteria bacterium]